MIVQEGGRAAPRSRGPPAGDRWKYAKAGFDHLILTQIGPEQDAFFDFFERELAPRLRQRAAAA